MEITEIKNPAWRTDQVTFLPNDRPRLDTNKSHGTRAVGAIVGSLEINGEEVHVGDAFGD